MINVESMPSLIEDDDELNTTYPTLGKAVPKPTDVAHSER